MRRSRRADADTPRDTPGDVEATRAAANAASSEEDSSYLSPLDKEPVRGTTGFNNMDNNKDYTSEYCYQPRSSHAPGEDTNASASVVTGRTRGDAAAPGRAGHATGGRGEAGLGDVRRAVAQAMRCAGCLNRRSLGVSDVFPPKQGRERETKGGERGGSEAGGPFLAGGGQGPGPVVRKAWVRRER